MITVTDKVSLSTSQLAGIQSPREKELPRQRFSDSSVASGDSARANSLPLFKEDRVTISREAQEIKELVSRDREVRSHEAAHASAGGSYAGTPNYTYQSGPDGQRYAVAGEVPIDTSPVPGDPQATLEKAQQVRDAAMAPEQPSAADQRIAAKANSMAAKARGEIMAERTKNSEEKFLVSSIEQAPSSEQEGTGSLINIYG